MLPRGDTMIATESLSLDRIRQALTAQVVGRQIYLFGEVASTNSVLVRLAKAGAREGTVVLAEGQTAGRGRLGKAWFSPAGVNLYASILFRPPIVPGEVAVFSFIVSLALADAIQEEGVEPAIKWPNDILVGRKKVAGVLAESVASGDRVDFVILGAGVNLNVERETLRSALGPGAQSAVSLHEAVGRELDRNAFAARFLTLLDEWFHIYLSKSAEVILQAWRDRDVTTGRRVEVREGPEVFDGRAIGVNTEGHLAVQDSYGKVRRVVSGEIRFMD
jgi:BirA family biotin operon repressor/biotin-[acetyl-CoA-carboxylase] ligase